MCDNGPLKANTIHPTARITPENTHKLMGLHMEVLMLGVIL